MRIKICRKESKESRFWLRLTDTNGITELENDKKALFQEAQELMNIFGSILIKSQNKDRANDEQADNSKDALDKF